MEEPAPSVTLPPTSMHVIVRCGDTPVVLRSLDDRCERHKRASRAWSARWPASPKGRIESEPRGPSQLRGVRGVAPIAPSQLRIVTIRHGLKVCVIILPCFGHFGWPFPSQDGPPEKKVPLGIRLKSTRPSHGRFWSRPLPREARQKKSTGGALIAPPLRRRKGFEQARAGDVAHFTGSAASRGAADLPSPSPITEKKKENPPVSRLALTLGSLETSSAPGVACVVRR